MRNPITADRLVAELAAPSMPVVILSGPPGVGKTALAVHVAHQVRADYPDGQLYADLQGYSPSAPLTPAVVLARFLHALGIPADQVPTDQEDQAGLYRSLLADRRGLVVLDNAAEPRQVRPLLPGQPGCAALVTSRSDLRGLVALEDGQPLAVEPLSIEDARAVLAALIDAERVVEEPAAVDRLAAECAGLPLALRIAAANLRANPHQSIADFTEALRVRGRLVQLQVPGDPQTAVRAAFDLSYARPGPAAARLFRLLSAVPGPDFDVAACAALIGADPLHADRAVDELVAANLVIRQSTHLLYPDSARLPLPSMVDGVRLLARSGEAAALAAARAQGDSAAEATMLDLIGMVHFAQSRYDLAGEYHVQALGIHRRVTDLDGQATSLYHRARRRAPDRRRPGERAGARRGGHLPDPPYRHPGQPRGLGPDRGGPRPPRPRRSSCAATCLAAAVQAGRRNGMRLIEARALDAYGRAVHANEGARAAAPHWRAAWRSSTGSGPRKRRRSAPGWAWTSIGDRARVGRPRGPSAPHVRLGRRGRCPGAVRGGQPRPVSASWRVLRRA